MGDGCVAIELASIDPPALKRDCTGNLAIRRRVTGTGVGACTHDRGSVTGIVATSQGPASGNWMIRASGLRP